MPAPRVDCRSPTLTGADAARLIAQGQLTSETLTRRCLKRIRECEPAVEAWEYLDPELALAQARLADSSPFRGPLHGVPLGIKDVIDTVDMPTMYGLRIYQDHRPPSDASCVALARAAGAIILGKTVTTEFGAGSLIRTRNPHNPLHTPGGSSSGSAAAVACAMVPWALGTQTLGSTIRPASFCGVVGYRATCGKAEMRGVKTLANSLDSLGFFARTVTDVALLASVVIGGRICPLREWSAPRIGLFNGAPWATLPAATHNLLEETVRKLSDAGAKVDSLRSPPSMASLREIQEVIFGWEVRRH